MLIFMAMMQSSYIFEHALSLHIVNILFYPIYSTDVNIRICIIRLMCNMCLCIGFLLAGRYPGRFSGLLLGVCRMILPITLCLSIVSISIGCSLMLSTKLQIKYGKILGHRAVEKSHSQSIGNSSAVPSYTLNFS